MLAAEYAQQTKALLLRHGPWLIAATLLSTSGYLWHYFYSVRVSHPSIDYATSLFQPMLVVYATTVSVLLYRVAAAWSGRLGMNGLSFGSRFWTLLGEASFGVYLVHPLILNPVVKQVTAAMPEGWPVAVRVFLTRLIVSTGAVMLTQALLRTPVLSRLVGRTGLFR